MPNADFQDRLKNISANSPQQHPVTRGAPHTGHPGTLKPNIRHFVVGAAIMMIGRQVLKYANVNYETLRDGSGIEKAAGLGFAGTAIFVIGIIVMICSIFNKRTTPAKAAASQYSANVRLASAGTRVFFSLLGFIFGTISCLCMFTSAASRFVETEAAQHIEMVNLRIAFFLVFVSLLFGIVGFFLRGYALGRVPVYFLFGGVLTFATVRVTSVNMLEWQQFFGVLQ
ncbi:hypothetical protein [Cochlodiniinecator piscidefendens]|uniref:hypothetical protein n=1 Tax=Cochlodiniinecator piscidefendens TaxID=2715756 RepID=UPI00140ABC65|nr:hypothetical protein [Cochlodiniinecator piscidefendens]